MNNSPLVSIIIPVFKTELYIKKCVESVLSQTYTNIEIILVDDESPDSCPQICDDYSAKDKRIRVIHKKNGGLSSARNAGLKVLSSLSKESSERYVTFLDSDDYLAADCIETLSRAMMDSGADVVNMSYDTVDEDGVVSHEGTNHSKQCELLSSEEFLQQMCYKKKSESVCVKLYKQSLIVDMEFEEGTVNEDFLFNSMLLLKNFQVVHIDYSGYYYLQRQGSISKSGANKAFYDSIRNPYKMMKRLENSRPNLIPYFARVALYQIRCISFVIPYKTALFGSDDFNDLKTVLRYSMKYMDECSFPNGYKSTLKLLNICPSVACMLLHSLYTIKH